MEPFSNTFAPAEMRVMGLPGAQASSSAYAGFAGGGTVSRHASSVAVRRHTWTFAAHRCARSQGKTSARAAWTVGAVGDTEARKKAPRHRFPLDTIRGAHALDRAASFVMVARCRASPQWSRFHALDGFSVVRWVAVHS